MEIIATTNAQFNAYPLLILGICIAIIVVLITVVRVHAFLALIIAAFSAGILAQKFPTLPPGFQEHGKLWQAIELTTLEFGNTAGKIAIVIALASVIGVCLMESGAADKIVRWFLKIFGEKRTGTAIAASSYFLSIPIFFDTFFMLLLPISRALSFRVGKDYLLYVLAICCGASVTHSLCAPHPGPLAMAEALKLDLGITIVAGILLGIIPTMSSWFVAKWMNRRIKIPIRETTGASIEDIKAIINKPESELPSLFMSILPVILPILLISTASFADAINRRPEEFPLIVSICGGQDSFKTIYNLIEFIGNRNMALLIGAIISIFVLARIRSLNVDGISKKIAPSLETAGMVILMTSAGGAFGLMLKNAGVGDAVKDLVAGHEINLILLSWLVASVIRIAQGSATVAMLTTAAMVYPIISGGTPLPFHPIYIFAAIGFGAMIFSWMNDSGFWVICKLSGFTEKEMLKTWSIIVTVNSVAGLIECLILAKLLPFK
ncbi:MAG TPA: SLC13 family permease [Verrucomicrobiota bacterium]|nr:SLC13 family permease [Verrucomicrobiota bacterium]